MSYYIKRGTFINITDTIATEVYTSLPARNYVVRQNQMTGEYYLEHADEFSRPDKVYGNSERQAERIINTFLDRNSCTGVLLAGEKGSGKTMLAKNLAIRCATLGIPCLIINSDFVGDGFNKFLQSIDVPCMVLFDEFEKVYDEDKQTEILTLLDGVFPSNKLFVLTCNDKWRLDRNMRNRPGRLFYMLDFNGLDISFIREYCEDKLKNKEYIEQICSFSNLFCAFNFDMLQALVEEMNRYDETPKQAMEMLNIKPEYSDDFTFTFELLVNNIKIPTENIYDPDWSGKILSEEVRIGFNNKIPQIESEKLKSPAVFLPEHIVKMDMNKGIVEYKNGDNRLTLKKSLIKSFNYEILL